MSSDFFLLSEKRSTLKGKNLLTMGENSFLLELNAFQVFICRKADSKWQNLSCL